MCIGEEEDRYWGDREREEVINQVDSKDEENRTVCGRDGEGVGGREKKGFVERNIERRVIKRER